MIRPPLDPDQFLTPGNRRRQTSEGTPMKKKVMSFIGIGLCAVTATAGAADTHIRVTAATCYICHGPDGKSEHAIPGLAGQDRNYLVQAMKEQKTAARETTVMRKYMLGYTDAEIEAMADFFASVK
jgi:cytochrome c553